MIKVAQIENISVNVSEALYRPLWSDFPECLAELQRSSHVGTLSFILNFVVANDVQVLDNVP